MCRSETFAVKSEKCSIYPQPTPNLCIPPAYNINICVLPGRWLTSKIRSMSAYLPHLTVSPNKEALHTFYYHTGTKFTTTHILYHNIPLPPLLSLNSTHTRHCHLQTFGVRYHTSSTFTNSPPQTLPPLRQTRDSVPWRTTHHTTH